MPLSAMKWPDTSLAHYGMCAMDVTNPCGALGPSAPRMWRFFWQIHFMCTCGSSTTPHFTFPFFFLLRSSRDPSPSHLNFSTHSPFLACRTCLGCYISNKGSSPLSHLLLRSRAHLSFPSSRDWSLISVSCPFKDVFMCIWMIWS